MASELASYYISILPSARGLTKNIAKEFSGVDREAAKAGKTSGSKFSGAFKGSMAGIAGAFAAFGIGSFVKDAVTAAGSLEQSVGAISSVFGSSAKDMQKWSKGAAKNVGLTSNEFNELGTLIGAQLKNGGTAMDELAPKTNELITLGADLSSMFGGNAKDAVAALSSALKGERDPIEKYGVSLNQAKIDAEAAALGFEKVGGALSAEATQAATMSLIMKQTTDAHGNFAKESDTFAHKQQVAAAEWGNLTTKIGEVFLPVFSGVIGFFSEKAMPIIDEIVGGVNAFGAAWSYNDGEITSSGFPGFMERVGYWARQAFDYFQTAVLPRLQEFAAFITGTVVPALMNFGKWIVDNKDKVAVIAGVIVAVLLPALVRMGVTSLISAGKSVAAWVMTQVAAIKTGVVYVAQSILMIGRWAWMGAQALIHAGRMALAWLIAMGPIGFVIAAVVGLAAIVIANWDKISTWTRDMWNKHVKPVFDNLANFITKNVPEAFDKGIKFIGKAWEKLKAIVRSPIDFVINKVINEGLIKGLNTIGGFLKLPEIPDVPQLPQFADGGYTGDGGRLEPKGVVHGGEFVLTKRQTRNAGVGNLYQLAKSLDGYAKGGLVHPLRASTVSQPFHGGHNGIDFAAPTGTPVRAAGGGRVSMAGWSAGGGGNEIHIDHPNGLQTWYSHLNSFAARAGEMVRAGSKIGEVGSTGNSTGPHLHYMVLNGGWPNYTNPAPYLDGGGEAGKGWNPISGIIDGLLGKFKEAFPAAGFIADLAIGVGKKLLMGASDFITGGGGKDNLGSTALYDQGGVLPVGLSQVVNRTRKPEAILNPQQWSDIHKLAMGGGNGGGVHIHGNVGWDPDRVAQEIEVRKRRSQTMAGMGGVVFA